MTSMAFPSIRSAALVIDVVSRSLFGGRLFAPGAGPSTGSGFSVRAVGSADRSTSTVGNNVTAAAVRGATAHPGALEVAVLKLARVSSTASGSGSADGVPMVLVEVLAVRGVRIGYAWGVHGVRAACPWGARGVSMGRLREPPMGCREVRVGCPRGVLG